MPSYGIQAPRQARRRRPSIADHQLRLLRQDGDIPAANALHRRSGVAWSTPNSWRDLDGASGRSDCREPGPAGSGEFRRASGRRPGRLPARSIHLVHIGAQGLAAAVSRGGQRAVDPSISSAVSRAPRRRRDTRAHRAVGGARAGGGRPRAEGSSRKSGPAKASSASISRRPGPQRQGTYPRLSPAPAPVTVCRQISGDSRARIRAPTPLSGPPPGGPLVGRTAQRRDCPAAAASENHPGLVLHAPPLA